MATKPKTRTTSEDWPAPQFRYRKPVRGSAVWWLRFLGVAAFLIVLLRLPPAQEAQLTRIDLRWLGLCMVFTVAQLLLEALAWHLLLLRQRLRHPYPKTLVAYLASQYLGMVTPGHVGEFLAAGYICMNTGITFGYALSSVVVKKALSWVALMGFGIWGLQLLGEVPLMRDVQWILVATVTVLVALSVGIMLWVLSLRRLARKWQRLSPWQIDMADFWAGMRPLRSSWLLLPLGVASLAFSMIFGQLYSILQAQGLGLSLGLAAKIAAFSRLVARAIPFSVVGYGTKDAAVIGMLTAHGIDTTVAVTTTLFYLVCAYLLTLLLSGLCWWIRPLRISRAAPDDLA
jgi:uncharacterized membrane protein YbhN (UPF0104 family)